MTARRAVVVLALALVPLGLSIWIPSLENLPGFVPPSTATLTGVGMAMMAYVGGGLLIWVRRPQSLVGKALTAVGFGGLLWGVFSYPHLSTLGSWLPFLLGPLLAVAVLAHPDGRLRRPDLIVVLGLGTATAAATTVSVTTWDPRPPLCTGCPATWFLVSESATVADVAARVIVVLGTALVVYTAVRAIQNYRGGSAAARRALEPVLWAIVPLAVISLLLLGNLFTPIGNDRFVSTPSPLALVAIAGIAIGFAVGELRARLSTDIVGGLVDELERGSPVGTLQEVMRDRLRDPTLTLGFDLSGTGSYVGADGKAVERPDPAASRTALSSGDGPRTIVYHDPAVDPELVQMIGSTAGLSFDNERLHAELRKRIEDVEESRARIVAAEDDVRKRVGRDLHDGAQQRLVSLGLALRIIEDRANDNLDEETAQLLAEARSEAASAIDELRELSQGLYPTLLTDVGLEAAVRRLGDRAPMVVSISAPNRRFAADVEACAYFVTAEALTNAIKHSEAGQIQIEISESAGALSVQVRDDGVGGASLNGGSGIRGLADRVDAAGGTIDLSSDVNGTTITAVIPCE